MPRGHFDIDFAGLAIEFALRLDAPAGIQQGVRRFWQKARRQFKIEIDAVIVLRFAETKFAEQRRRGSLRPRDRAPTGGVRRRRRCLAPDSKRRSGDRRTQR